METATPTQTPKIDAVELVRQLDPETIRARLDELDAERQSLLVLLRSALSRNKRRKASHAS